MWQFENRREAGRKLAEKLEHYAKRDGVIVLALPRGGVPVAYEVAAALELPLDVLIVRKLGAPGHRELAMGAVASGGVRVVNEAIVASLGVSPAALEATAQEELRELRRREQRYRGGRPPLSLAGRTVLLIDDGVATGASMRAALSALHQLEPARIVVAVPTAAKDACQALEQQADEVVCLMTPEPYHAVGAWYREFPQTSDEEVRRLLEMAARGTDPSAA